MRQATSSPPGSGPTERPRSASRWLDGLLAALFPGRCLACDGETPGGPFCEPCTTELREAAGPACPRCAMPVGPGALVVGGCSECRGRSLGFDAAMALGPYQGPLRAACLTLKRTSGAWLAPWLADLVLGAHAGASLTTGEPLVVPIPLHWRRAGRRGYNQSDALARRVAARLGLVRAAALRRVVPTPPLARLGRQRRAELMRSAFRVRAARLVRDRPVLLIDDILTTGATCGAAARALKQAGAARVTVVVVARAEGLA